MRINSVLAEVLMRINSVLREALMRANSVLREVLMHVRSQRVNVNPQALVTRHAL